MAGSSAPHAPYRKYCPSGRTCFPEHLAHLLREITCCKRLVSKASRRPQDISLVNGCHAQSRASELADDEVCGRRHRAQLLVEVPAGQHS